MNLTAHFTLEEMVFSSTATVRGIDNTPPPSIVERLRSVAYGLETIRSLLGNSIHIDSGYRCEALNLAVRGVPNSAHVDGWAADFICPSFGTPLEIVHYLTTKVIKYDQLIQEGTWVHISFAPALRQAVLTAHFVNGKATYQRGVFQS